MPGKTNSDKISELEKLGEKLTGQIDAARDEHEKVYNAHSKTQEGLAD